MVKEKRYFLGLLSIFFICGSLYLYYQLKTIYGGDAGDLVSAIVTAGIPHPPGYPLYTSLGILILKFVAGGTAAWKVGFLSSIPSLISLLFLFDIFYILTGGSVFIPLLSVFSYAFLYPIWLYSEAVEVFALNNLFIILLFWAALRFTKEKKSKYIYLFSFFLGLSFTHHQIIIFVLPGLLWLLLKNKRLFRKTLLIKSILLFIAGLLPYIYILLPSLSYSPLNWQGQATPANVIALVSRAGYGTFKVGSFVMMEPALRALDVWAAFNFVFNDFRVLGIILILAGSFYLFRKKRDIFFMLLFSTISYLFFIFYASFPLVGNFLVGTFERFVQPLYILLTFFTVFGLLQLYMCIKVLFTRLFSSAKSNTVLSLFVLMFIIYPAGIFLINYPKITILRDDFTAENLAYDILSSLPKNSIFIISTDTPLFNTQYIYYTQKIRPDVKLIHLGKFGTPYYFDQLKRSYPDLTLPQNSDDTVFLFKSFVKDNYGKFPIFSKLAFGNTEGVWIPWGLVFRYYKKGDVPKKEFIHKESEKLWSSYHDPLSGSLSRFQNLLLSDNLSIYSTARQETGFWEAKNGYSNDAERNLLRAESLNPGDSDSYTILAQVYIEKKQCQDAKKQIEAAERISPDSPTVYFLMSINYAVCFQDKGKAEFYRNLYDEKTRGKQVELKQL